MLSLPLKESEEKETKTETTSVKVADPGKELATREARKAERLKIFKPPKNKADKLAERNERLKVWRDRYGLGSVSE